METKTKKYEIDMCSGPLVGKMLVFTLPLIASSLLQLLFNAVDMIVAGQFAGETALASIGATGSLTNLIVNLFIGLSVGANVLTARYFAQKNTDDVSETVHTSVVVSLVFGVILAVFGWFFAKPLLELMATPENVIDGAAMYMKIYFLGMPVIMLYNFTAAVLRAVGDTKRPLYYLAIAGVINIFLNLFFVVVVGIGVAGVAIATVVSQCVSASLVMITLLKYDGCLKVEPKKLAVSWRKLGLMARIGLPAGVQGMLFSISNVLIQSSINSFGDVAMSGSTAGANLEGFVYVTMNAFHHTALSFTSQNYGRRNMDRVRKTAICAVIMASIAGLVFGTLAWLLREPLLSLYVKKTQESYSEVIRYGVIRMTIIMLTYFTCGQMDTLVGALRGLGHSILPMIVSLTFCCLLRVVWIMTAFQKVHTLECLYLSYPLSWIMATLFHAVCFVIIYRKLKKTCV